MKEPTPLAGMGPFASALVSAAFGQFQGWGPGWIILLAVATSFLLPIASKSGVGIGNALQRVCEVKIPAWFGVPPAVTTSGNGKRTKAPATRAGVGPP